MLQAYLGAGSLFPSELTFANGIEFHVESFNADIQCAVRNLHFTNNNTIMSNTVTYRGTVYKHGMFVLLEETEDGFVVAKLFCMLVFEGSILFCVVRKYDCIESVDSGSYYLVLNDSEHVVVCINANDLLDFYPLNEYKKVNFSRIVLHHAVLSS